MKIKKNQTSLNQTIESNDKCKDSIVIKDKKKKDDPYRFLWKYKTYKQKKKTLAVTAIVMSSILVVICAFLAISAILGAIGYSANMKKIQNLASIGYEKELDFTVEKDADGFGYSVNFTGETRELKVLQLTDIHIGGGGYSIKKDSWAIDAVYKLVKDQKPDLIVVTGDVAYPVGFQSGSFNNMKEAKLFVALMEKIDVYWTMVYGNHDTEIYSQYDRADISKYYEGVSNQKNSKLLFTKGMNAADGPNEMGYGNFTIDIKNNAKEIIHTLYLLDSHSYTEDGKLGLTWEYDKLHDKQVEWYKNEVAERATKGVGGVMPKSTMYFHIPLLEFREAWNAFLANGRKNITEVDLKKNGGKFDQMVELNKDNGIIGEQKKLVYSSDLRSKMYDAVYESDSTIGIFNGHDHYNNVSLFYGDKKIMFAYGMSIDYLAYPTIYRETAQRGCRGIVINTDGTFSTYIKPLTSIK